MFEQAVLSSGPASKRVWTTFAGITGQALLVTFAVMIPMIWPEAIPSYQSLSRVFMPTAPLPPPPKGASAALRITHVARPFDPRVITVPTSMPTHPQTIIDPAPDPGASFGVEGGVPGGVPNGVPGGLASDILRGVPPAVAPPPPVVHAAAAAAPERPIIRIRDGGLVHLGQPIRRVEPRY